MPASGMFFKPSRSVSSVRILSQIKQAEDSSHGYQRRGRKSRRCTFAGLGSQGRLQRAGRGIGGRVRYCPSLQIAGLHFGRATFEFCFCPRSTRRSTMDRFSAITRLFVDGKASNPAVDDNVVGQRDNKGHQYLTKFNRASIFATDKYMMKWTACAIFPDEFGVQEGPEIQIPAARPTLSIRCGRFFRPRKASVDGP